MRQDLEIFDSHSDWVPKRKPRGEERAVPYFMSTVKPAVHASGNTVDVADLRLALREVTTPVMTTLLSSPQGEALLAAASREANRPVTGRRIDFHLTVDISSLVDAMSSLSEGTLKHLAETLWELRSDNAKLKAHLEASAG